MYPARFELTYNELILHKPNYSYSDLLNVKEWKHCRERIIARDQSICQRCNEQEGGYKLMEVEGSIVKVYSNKKLGLQVHHLHYVMGKLPWEYSDDQMLTLCRDCHAELHQKEEIPVFCSGVCAKCGGSGFLPEYSHVWDGVCFECSGTGYVFPVFDK